ncbi:31 kDa ribonucleoprotein, chloroplastic [Ricinus communis]|uniref:Ribonucleoprotein, chloroplast, putative n=1 Tax=Ricinus communis TaxID=3988 RepID=B9RNK5_RICCO|nr:31 kDa ribonucleoprotein, chloroplastic [Ricinus communis]EEF47060.1 ribonucleoprotein, chloroplast, putative [Ricinus communis]|eukprot:XP_002515076.1 31 kDa ribonucleoprotein, chloroplastic [Ricinus communis]
MATIRLVPSLPSSFRTPTLPSLPFPKFSCFLQSHSREIPLLSSSSSLWPANKSKRVFAILALVNEESVVAEEVDREENENESEEDELGRQLKKQPRPCELYVCNLPRSCDIAELVELFKPYGTVISVEVSRNPETGISRGCGFVTMGSINSAKNAIAALDGSDIGGREMRVKFSVDMNSGRRNPEPLSSAPTKNLFYESPFKVYVGNLAWTVKPEELRDQFSKFGTVVSARVLYDRKAGKNRAYGFLSFSSTKERDAALSFNGKDFRGRILVVRKGVERED